MSKGLEALKRIKMLEISCDMESYDIRPITKTHKEDLKTIEKELKKLEEVDYILKDSGLTFDDLQKVCFAYTVLKMRSVDKKLKALEIIKKKNFDLFYLQDSKDLEMYNDACDHFRNLCYLTQEEYDLLKEVLL